MDLIETNDMDRNYTYYVGDRKLDMECARNAGITGILYMPEGSFGVSGDETFRINELIEIISAKGELKAYVHSFGCQLNVSDGEKIKGVLK